MELINEKKSKKSLYERYTEGLGEVFSKESLEKDLENICQKKNITLTELKKMVAGNSLGDEDILTARSLLLTLSSI